MKKQTFGKLNARIVGGTDREGGGEGPVVVLLHGFGAPGEDLVPLWRVLDVPRETRFVFPEAPVSLGPMYGEGRAWWMIDIARLERAMMTGELRDLTHDVPDGLLEARLAMIDFLDHLHTDLKADSAKTVLGGFSQGAMLSLDVALHTSRPFAGLVMMSGTLLAQDVWVPLMPSRAGLPVFQSHGSMDQLLPFVIAERLRDEMKSAGLNVTWSPFRGGHEIPQGVLVDLNAFLQRVLTASGA